MSCERNGNRKATRWVASLAVLGMLAGCAGDVDNDKSRSPDFTPPDSDPAMGRITLTLERDSIPADGTTLVEAVAVVTDAQGVPIRDSFVLFTSEFEDVTWLTAQRVPPSELSPNAPSIFSTNECGEFTNSDGRASCILRSSFTEGSTELRADAVDILLRATNDIEFTFSGGGPGLSLTLLECASVVAATELPATRRIVVQALQTIDAASNTIRPAADVRVFVSSTNGKFENGRDDRSVRTNAFGVAELEIEFSESSRDSAVQILAAVSGGLPVTCQITIGDFLPPTIAFFVVPDVVTAQNPDKQELSVAVQLTSVPSFDQSTVVFGSPIGTFSPNPAGVDLLTGFAETIWTITPTESFQLVSGVPVPIAVSVNYGADVPAQASTEVEVSDFFPRSVEDEGGEPEVDPPAE